jgi:hypothetical protein
VTVLSVPNPAGVKHSYLESVAFSPDGSKLALARRLNPSAGKTEHGIYTMGLDGSGLLKIAEGSSPDWQPVPPSPPPPPPAAPSKAKAVKHKVKLSKSGKGSVGAIVCGSSPCTLRVLSATLTAGKKICPVKAKLPKQLAPGKSASVRVRVAGKCRAALNAAGKGSLVVRVQVSDALGKRVLRLRSTLVAASAKKHGKK